VLALGGVVLWRGPRFPALGRRIGSQQSAVMTWRLIVPATRAFDSTPRGLAQPRRLGRLTPIHAQSDRAKATGAKTVGNRMG